jgi:uncharacterized membrane protein YhhN
MSTNADRSGAGTGTDAVLPPRVRLAIAAVLIAGALAIAGAELPVRPLTVIFKPLTTILLLLVVGKPGSRFAWAIVAGVLFSLVGDVALLSNSDMAFVIGLSGFLLAHVSYVIANVMVARWSRHVVVVAVLAIIASVTILSLARASSVAIRVATIFYGTAITSMVVSASATVGGRLPVAWARLAAIGAVLFYISDSSLALDRFHEPIPHVAYLTMGVYWLGQIGIALAARGPVAAAASSSAAAPGVARSL